MEQKTELSANKDMDCNLILSLISYAQSDKEGFRKYAKVILGKEYSNEEIKNMLETLRTEINNQRF